MSVVKQLPGRLRAARIACQAERAAVAVAIHRSAETVTGYECGRILPPLDVLERLAEHYETTLADLLAGDDQ